MSDQVMIASKVNLVTRNGRLQSIQPTLSTEEACRNPPHNDFRGARSRTYHLWCIWCRRAPDECPVDPARVGASAAPSVRQPPREVPSGDARLLLEGRRLARCPAQWCRRLLRRLAPARGRRLRQRALGHLDGLGIFLVDRLRANASPGGDPRSTVTGLSQPAHLVALAELGQCPQCSHAYEGQFGIRNQGPGPGSRRRGAWPFPEVPRPSTEVDRSASAPSGHFMPLTSDDLSVARWCGCLAAKARSTQQTVRTDRGAALPPLARSFRVSEDFRRPVLHTPPAGPADGLACRGVAFAPKCEGNEEPRLDKRSTPSSRARWLKATCALRALTLGGRAANGVGLARTAQRWVQSSSGGRWRGYGQLSRITEGAAGATVGPGGWDVARSVPGMGPNPEDAGDGSPRRRMGSTFNRWERVSFQAVLTPGTTGHRVLLVGTVHPCPGGPGDRLRRDQHQQGEQAGSAAQGLRGRWARPRDDGARHLFRGRPAFAGDRLAHLTPLPALG